MYVILNVLPYLSPVGTAFNEHVASMQTRATPLAFRFSIARVIDDWNGWLVLFVLSSEKMDFYENIKISTNVAANISLGSQHLGSHDQPCCNKAHCESRLQQMYTVH